MSVQGFHRFTVGDYPRLAETGGLRPDARVELLDERIIDMSPNGPFHGGVADRPGRLFHRVARDRWLLSVQNPVRLDAYSKLQPDMMLLKPVPDDYIHRHPGLEDVFRLIEAADTTLEPDREEKLPAYGRAGIPEVWIVNLLEHTIEVHRIPGSAGSASRQVWRAGDQGSPAAFPDARMDVGELLQH